MIYGFRLQGCNAQYQNDIQVGNLMCNAKLKLLVV